MYPGDAARISELLARQQYVHEIAPTDIFTRAARAITGVFTLVNFVLFPLQLVTTAVGGCLIAITFGLLLIPLTLIWLVLLGPLVGTSWLWLRVPLLRPLLLLVGPLLAWIADAYLRLMPDPERLSKVSKIVLAQDWPLTWWHMRLPEWADFDGWIASHLSEPGDYSEASDDADA